MSTMERYGTAVWEGLVKNTAVYADVYVQWATVGEVALTAGVSRSTAKKYLDMLVEKGAAKSMKFGKRVGYSIVTSEGL